MYCPKCGTENGNEARVCVSCGQVLPAGSPIRVKVSRLAIAAFVLGILSLFTLGLTALPAVVVGIVALVGINRSGGRLTGDGFATAGIVVSVCALFLMGILWPALARERQVSLRLSCGTNLAGIGKAMLIYPSDYDDELPRAGGPSTTWGPMPADGWLATTRAAAYGVDPNGAGGTASITSNFYLLVRYADMTPKSFICRSDRGAREFKPSEYARLIPPGRSIVDLWDFGPAGETSRHCSYSYHTPFNQYALTTSNEPGFAVAADRNPFIPSRFVTPAKVQARYAGFMPDATGPGVSAPGTGEMARRGNAIAHAMDGQNVLFLDSHVEFAMRAFCSVEDDNIYTISTLANRGDLRGMMPTPGPTCVPANRKDSLLVQDPK